MSGGGGGLKEQGAESFRAPSLIRGWISSSWVYCDVFQLKNLAKANFKKVSTGPGTQVDQV